MEILLIILLILAIYLILTLIMVAPASCPKPLSAPFVNRYFAHRGLHNKEKTIPENSMAAYALACERGYGMELDVRLTKDGYVVTSHDDSMLRMTDVDISIEKNNYEDLAKHPLGNSDERLALFSEVLKLVGGRVPLIVEIKPCENSFLLCEKIKELLSSYEGEIALESFDPYIVKWIRNNMPNTLRGQLASRTDFYKDTPLPWFIAHLIAQCYANFISRPHFVAYEVGFKPLPVRATKLMGAPHFTWTSRPKEMGGDPEADARLNDAVIFEFYEPPLFIHASKPQ